MGETYECSEVDHVPAPKLGCEVQVDAGIATEYEFSTIDTHNEIETYLDDTVTELSDMTGGEVIYEIVFNGAPGNFQLNLSQGGTVFEDDLHMIVVTDECESASTSYITSDDTGIIDAGVPDAGLTYYVIIDGDAKNRGWGTISMTCGGMD